MDKFCFNSTSSFLLPSHSLLSSLSSSSLPLYYPFIPFSLSLSHTHTHTHSVFPYFFSLTHGSQCLSPQLTCSDVIISPSRHGAAFVASSSGASVGPLHLVLSFILISSFCVCIDLIYIFFIHLLILSSSLLFSSFLHLIFFQSSQFLSSSLPLSPHNITLSLPSSRQTRLFLPFMRIRRTQTLSHARREDAM